MDLKGRSAVITGGASGLGRATAELFADSGSRVALFDVNGDKVLAAADTLGDEAIGLEVDVADPGATKSAVQSVLEAFGEIHICINAAGVPTAGAITNGDAPLPLDQFRRVIDVNLVGAFDVMRHCVTAMVANEPIDGERGVVINVTSPAAWQGQRGQAAYSASKAGLIGLILPVARDVARYGIRVVAVAPGLFATDMAKSLPRQVLEALEGMILNPKRLGDPPEFALLARHIVENPYLNATTISIDAGTRLT